MCYTTYLWHGIAIGLAWKLTHAAGHQWRPTGFYLVQVALVVPLVILMSAFLFRFLERPFMQRDWPTRLRRRLRGLPAQAP